VRLLSRRTGGVRDLTTADTLELLAKAPDPASAARLTTAQISAVLKRARRRAIPEKAAKIQAALRAEHLGQPDIVATAYAATVRSAAAVLTVLNEQIKVLEGQVEAHFGVHPAAEIILSQPGLGPILGARVLAEFGDAQGRYADAKSRRNYAGTSPITRASGKKKTVMARHIHNDRLIDALGVQAFARSKPRPAPAPTTISSKPATSVTSPPCGNSATGSSASCTDVLRPARSTTKRPLGRIAPRLLQLDI
jgi:hypothetical protein